MFLRYKRWRACTPQTPYKGFGYGQRTYLFTVETEGVCFVPFREDIEKLLNPRNGVGSLIEIAYERYGIVFDANGKAEVPTVPGTPSVPEDDAEPSAPTPRLRGRPRKS